MSYRLVLVSAVLAAVMSACVLPPPVPDAVVVNKYGQSNVSEVFNKLNNEYNVARQEGLEFFAPSQFKLGLNAIIQAGTLKKDRADDMEIFRQLYIAEQQLSICRQIKDQAEKQLPELLTALDTLEALSVDRSYPQEFDSLAYKVSKLVGDIEDSVLGKPVVVKKDSAREKAELLKELLQLEVKVVKFNTLNESQKVFKEVESLGGGSLAPKTYREAEQALQTANSVIEKDVKDKVAIEKAGKDYEFAAFHALHVTRAVSTLQSLSRSDYEQYILDLENKLLAIAQAFDYRDIRNHAIGEQIMVLTGLANRLTNEKNRLAKIDLSAPSEDTIDVGKLQAEHEKAHQTIKDLTEQIMRLQEKPASDTVVISEQEKQLRKKVVQLEEQISRLLLENNDLKSQQNRAAK